MDAVSNLEPLAEQTVETVNASEKEVDIMMEESIHEKWEDRDEDDSGDPSTDAHVGYYLNKADRYELIQTVTERFWARWTDEVTPECVIRQKWHETGRNLQNGDVVLVHDQ